MKKTEINKKISMIVNKYKVNTHLDKLDSEFIYELLDKTKTYNHIIPNYSYLYIGNYKIANNRRVKMIFANDGNRNYPISKGKLINELFPPKSSLTSDEKHINNVKKAARNIINSQIKQFRESVELPITCPLSHKILKNWRLIHIDHDIPFSILFDNWMEELNISPLDIELCGPKNNKTFKNVDLLKSWYLYHLKNAKLQCVYSKANLIKSNKIYE